MTEKQTIYLQIDCVRIRLNVVRDEEHFYREAAALLNQKYKYYRDAFTNLSTAEIWVYTALDVAVQLQKQKENADLKPIAEKIIEINKLMQNELTKKENCGQL